MSNLDTEQYFKHSAETLLSLLTQCQRKPIHRQARNLSEGEAGMLRCLHMKRAPMSATELKQAMGIGSGGVANLLNALERKGYIVRAMNPSDRRSVMVSLSEAGSRLAREKSMQALSLTTGLLSRLGKEDTDALIRIYRRMLLIAEEYRQSHNEEFE